MPAFILRIILQRILLFVYSVLIFLGIAPQIQINQDREIDVTKYEERKQIIENILSERPPRGRIPEIEERIEQDRISSENLEKVSPQIQEPDIQKDVDTDQVKSSDSQPEQKQQEQEQTPKEAPKQSATIPLSPALPIQIPEISPITQSRTSGSDEISIENVVVNTICTEKIGNTINVFTGSGVIISPRGVILTNAHVAQFFLLQEQDKSINCSVYRQNTYYGYKAEILYISKNWITKNYASVRNPSSKGTGEDDYAFLHITKTTNPSIKPPENFPYARVNILNRPSVGNEVIAAGYPGGPSNILQMSQAGKLKRSFLSVIEILTFGNNNPDVIKLSRSEIGAKGSSGGGVFLPNTQNSLDLIAIIVTTDDVSGNSKLNAITTDYINRAISKESGTSINYYISGNIPLKSNQFKEANLENLSSLLLSQQK